MFWNVLESRGKSYFLAILFSVVVASILNFAVNFLWYYAGREAERRVDAKRDFANVKTVVQMMDGKDSNAEKAIIENVITVSSGHVSIAKLAPSGQGWKIENDVKILPDRTIVEESDQFIHGDYEYLLRYTYANRPSYLGSALLKGWTWSIADLMKDSDSYFKYNYYWRSTPLWSCFLIILTLSALFVRELRKRHQLFMALETESVEQVKRIEALERANSTKINSFSDDLQQIEVEKGSLEASLVLMKEDADFLESEAIELEEKVAELGKRYAAISTEKNAVVEQNIQLINQMESIRELISTRFNNMRVENIVEFLSEKNVSEPSLNVLSIVDSESKEFRKLLKLITSYVDLRGGSKVNFPDHGTNHVVKEFYSKFDNDFLARFFCHISSDSYSESNVNRIKVLVNDGNADGYDGKVNIYIKNGRYGCCLSLRFNKRTKVNTANLGYALALVVKSKFKFLDSYEIKAA